MLVYPVIRARRAPTVSEISRRPTLAGTTRTSAQSIVAVIALITCAIIVALLKLQSAAKVTAPTVPHGSQSASEIQQQDLPSLESGGVRALLVTQTDTALQALPSDDRLARVTGRLVQAPATPIAGVPMVLTIVTDARGKMEVRSPQQHLDALSDLDGRFTIRFSPSTGSRVTLLLSPQALCGSQWQWTDVEPGQVLDLGDIVLEVGGTIIGRIIDKQGRSPSDQEWTIVARRASPSQLEGRDNDVIEGRSDRSTGEFELRNVPSGTIGLEANLASTHQFRAPSIELKPGETVYVDLICPYQSIRSRIGVVVSCPPFGQIQPSTLSPVLLTDGSGKSVSASLPSRQSHCFSFDNVAPGSYTVTINDPDYVPWTASDVRPGRVLEARLAGAAGVQLSVFDARTLEPLTEYSVRAELHSPHWRSQAVVVLESTGPAPAAIVRLIPVAQTLIIRAPNHADSYIPDLDLVRGEVRKIEVRMSAGVRVTGRVLQGEALTPLGGAIVRILRRSAEQSVAPGLLADEDDVRVAVSEPSTGSFAFAGLAPGTYWVQASASASLHTAITSVTIAEGDVERIVDLSILASAFFRGHIVGPPGAKFDGMLLVVVPSNQPGSSDGVIASRKWRQKLGVRLSQDGEFRVGPLQPGPARVSLLMPDASVPDGFNGSRTTGGDRVDLGTITLAPGDGNVHDFDARLGFPGTINVTCFIDGQAAAGRIVELLRPCDGYLQTMAGGVISGTGALLLGPMVPGEYVLLVRPVDSSWYWIAPTRVVIAPCTDSSVHQNFTLESGTIDVVMSNSDRPFGRTRFVIRLDSELPVPRIYTESDDSGKLPLSLPPGRYTVAHTRDGRGAGESSRTPFEWPIKAGGPQRISCLE